MVWTSGFGLDWTSVPGLIPPENCHDVYHVPSKVTVQTLKDSCKAVFLSLSVNSN